MEVAVAGALVVAALAGLFVVLTVIRFVVRLILLPLLLIKWILGTIAMLIVGPVLFLVGVVLAIVIGAVLFVPLLPLLIVGGLVWLLVKPARRPAVA
ncbi:MAG: hypothetical protein HOQ29_14775 [Acidobacteria bacterium]|nr:hypothetical protein [Acidobacteriota bacterium]